MIQAKYESHIMHNELLPFIFHNELLYNESICANWHLNIEILYCVSGSGNIKCDAQTYEFTVDDIFVVNSNKIHVIQTDSSIQYYCIIIDDNFCRENGIISDKTMFKEKINDAELNEIYKKTAENFINKNNSLVSTLSIRSDVLALLAKLCEKYLITDNNISEKNNTSIDRSKQAMTYIRANISKPITLEDIAQHCCVSKCYLSREFKKNTGQTIFEYINILRCKEAKMLILQGMSASSAAMSCGFENMSYFTKTYKRYIGILPSKTLMENS